jgi:hypothetical protein
MTLKDLNREVLDDAWDVKFIQSASIATNFLLVAIEMKNI